MHRFIIEHNNFVPDKLHIRVVKLFKYFDDQY